VNKYLKWLLAAVAGCTLPLAFAPLDLYPLAFASPALLFWLWRDASPRQAFILGLIFGYGLFGVGVSWVYVAIHDVGQSPLSISLLLTFLFVSILAVFPGFVGAFAARLRHRQTQTIWLLATLPASWVLFEWLRGWVFTGFTWLQLGYSQTDLWLSNVAPIGGVYLVSWLVAFSAALLVVLLPQKGRWRWGALAGIGIIWISSSLLGLVHWSHPVGNTIKVSLIQGNAPQITKWDKDKITLRLDRYASLTREHWDSDLIIWPENSLTLFYHTLEDNYLKQLDEEAKQHDTDLLFGVPYMNQQTGQYYSTFASLGKTPGMYHKAHLVPFGEYIPLQSLLRGLIGFFDLPMTGFSQGSRQQKPLIVAGQVIAPTVCFEDAFGEEVIRHLPQASLLVNGSNNAWYGDSFAPHQHLQISRMRAIETARPLLRVTTNGISAFVDEKGHIKARSPQFETFVLTQSVQPRQGETLYVLWGNTPVIVLLMLVLSLTWIVFKYRKV